MKKLIFGICITVSVVVYNNVNAQTTYPWSSVNQSYAPPSPNAQAFQSDGNDPVALYGGLPSISIPIYTVKCGSLTLPISLSYSYSGLNPLQDAGWVGLGWNLNAGGVITRTVEGKIDSSQNTGYNYGEYSISDSLVLRAGIDSFLQRAYNLNASYTNKSYDMAPDVYDAEFNGYSGKFFWCRNRPYLLSYNKQLVISTTSQNVSGTVVYGFNITTDDGVQYFFSNANAENTSFYCYAGNIPVLQTYKSAWFLTRVISSDKKDTINLNYASYQWQQAQTSYQSSYTLSLGAQASFGYDTTSYNVNPSISTQVLASITCRNSRVVFVPDTATRTDVKYVYPALKEIDVIDSVTGNTVKKNTFSYEYFGLRKTNPNLYERLALKRFKTVNVQLSSDTLSYTFKYLHESDTTFPAKTTYGIDYWGYYNGQDANTNPLPSTSSPFYGAPQPTGAGFSSNRVPNITYSVYGALDTIVYPAGGYTAFNYEENAYAGSSIGPGIRVVTTSAVSNNPLSPQAIQKKYTYLLDDGVTSSGFLGNPPNFTNVAFVLNQAGNIYNYNTYVAPLNSGAVGGIPPNFYYSKVTETVISGLESHRSDHYFTSFPTIFPDIRETERVDYLNTSGTTFIPLSKTFTNYFTTGSMDTSFPYASAYIDTEYMNVSHVPHTWYSYNFFFDNWQTYWIHPNYQQTFQYDANGDSTNVITYFNYNSVSNNVSSTITQNLSDGQSLIKKFKYPEDYSSSLTGNMVTAGITTIPIESQTWLYKSGSDSVMIGGTITQFDQTVFKPISTYAIETTKPITSLNNETISGGKFTTLLSDSRYILKSQLQYDGNNNLSVATKASDVNVSYLWDYHHSNVIAQIRNASQSDVAATSFESDGKGNWSFTGSSTTDTTSPTGNMCYNIGQASGSVTKSSLTSSTNYIVSYWTKGTALTITGTVAGYPLQGKTINGWTYFEHKVTGQTSVTVSYASTKYIDELRLYPYTAQMTTYTFNPLIGISTQCDADNRITYYKYDPFARLHVVLDQDRNIIKTIQYHYIGETNE
jgi:hypothetical protein